MSLIKRWGPVLAWMALIFVLSAQSQLPSPPPGWLDVFFEKSSHTFEYLVLGALVVRAMSGDRAPPARVWGLAILLTWLYALSDEFHQYFVPGRSADWVDVLFDWLGTVLGVGLWLQWQKKRRREAPEA